MALAKGHDQATGFFTNKLISKKAALCTLVDMTQPWSVTSSPIGNWVWHPEKLGHGDLRLLVTFSHKRAEDLVCVGRRLKICWPCSQAATWLPGYRTQQSLRLGSSSVLKEGAEPGCWGLSHSKEALLHTSSIHVTQWVHELVWESA